MLFCSFSLIYYSCFPFATYSLFFSFSCSIFPVFSYSCIFSFSIIKRYILRPYFVRLLDFAFSPHFPIH